MSVLVTLQPAAVEVDPGTTAECVVRVRNTGQIVDRFTIEVLGDAAPWVTVTPAALSLFPGAEDTARIEFSPASGSEPRAGRIVFGVRVRSSETPADSVVEEGSVTVRPYTAASAILVPQTSRGSRNARHDVTVMNGGNVPVEVVVVPSDPDRLLAFDVRPPRLSLRPAETGSVRVTVRPNETFLNGTPQSHPFVVGVTSSGQAPFELRGSMLQRAILPSWTLRAVGLAAGVAALAVVGLVTGVGRPGATPSPSTAVIETPSPTQPPTEAPSVALTAPPTEAPPSEEITAPPSPTPTPLPSFELASGGTSYEATNFQFACTDDVCREDVINGMRFIAANLQGPAFGAILLSTTNFDPESLPLILEATTGSLDWKSTGSAGKTTRFVVDLAPLVKGTGPAYGVLQDEANTLQRFEIPNSVAAQILDRAYDSTVMTFPTFSPIPMFEFDSLLLPLVTPAP